MELAELKGKSQEIKDRINAEQVKTVIETDLGLREKNKKYNCFLHNDKEPSMSFDYKSKRFKCFACGGNYDIFNHYMEYKHLNFIQAMSEINKDFNLGIELENIDTSRKPKKAPRSFPKAGESVYTYLGKRGLTKATIDHIGLYSSKDGVVFAYCNELGEHISNKIRFFNPSNPKMKMIFEKETNINTLYNMDKVDINKPLYICEGEIDCVSLVECGIDNAVSIPSGCASTEWIKVCWDWLQQFEEIIIWFDNDSAGKEASKNVQGRLNNLVKIVNNDLCNDINEMLVEHGKETVIKYSTNFQRIENIADWEMIPDYNVYESEKINSGIKDLDRDIMGFVFPSLSIITGTNGSGKSTLINQMCVGESISAGHKVFVYSGELHISHFRYWLEHTMANEYHIKEGVSKEGKKYSLVTDEGKKYMRSFLKDKMYFYDKEDVKYGELIKKMEEVARREGVRVFVIDNLLTLDLECRESEEYFKQKEVVKAFKDFANKYNVIVHLVAHPRKVMGKITKDDVGGSGAITNLAHYVIGVHRVNDKDGEEHDHDCELLLLKDRHTGTGYKEYNLNFKIERRRFYKTIFELSKDYGYCNNEMIEVEEECPYF